MKTRLLLVDDHSLFRDGLRALFSFSDEFEVAGEAASGSEAFALAERLRPDITLMDINLGADDGVEVTRAIRARLPGAKVVMLTVYDDTEKLLEAIKAGACGYLVKSIKSDDLLEQLRGVTRDEAALTRRMAARILEEFRRREDESPSAETILTTRELEVLELVAARMSNKEIATRLVISEHTVKNHLKSILSKLQLRSRREAAVYGVSRGWVAARPQPGP